MATSLYHILSVRAESLTHDEAVRSILADIPMFAVGIFALGTFTFLLLLRRVDWVVGCLHGAVLAAFIAGILDLVEVLCRRRQTDETVLNNNPLLALTISREIAYALSFGLRFLFFWAYAGCPPPKDVKSSGTMHCGSWSRWGLFGHILRWSLLVAVVAIASLQVTYRIYTPLRQIDLLHQIEGVVEVSVSAVFILKLLLNVYLANLDSAGTISRLNVLLCYSPMIIALSMSVAIGAVDVIQSLFSESILGRLLQGVELYIVILYMLVVTCGPLNEEAMKQQPPSRLNRSSSFHNFGARLSGFLMGPPRISLAPIPPMQTFMPTDDVKVREGNSPVHRPSYANRLSTWVSSRRVSFRSDLPRSPGLDRLWDQDRAERGSSPVGLEPKPSRTSHETYPEPKQSPAYPDPVYTSILRESATEDGLAETADPVLPLASPRSVQELLRVPRALTPNSTDSPIHGLHGIIQPLQRRPTEKSTTSQAAPDPDDPRLMFDESARSSGISGLLRQQEELDKSIAALKLFSADANTNRDTRSSFDTTSHTTKAASEFSLSNFPEPPWGRASVDSMSTVRPIVPVVPVVEEPEELVIEEVGRNREQSIPVSENGIREILTTNRNVRSESGGTQYEITSFIGDLTRPGHTAQASMSSVGSARRALAPPPGTSQTFAPSPLSIPERPQRPKVSLDIEAVQASLSPTTDSPMMRPEATSPSSPPRIIGLPSGPKPKLGSPVASSISSRRTDGFVPTRF